MIGRRAAVMSTHVYAAAKPAVERQRENRERRRRRTFARCCPVDDGENGVRATGWGRIRVGRTVLTRRRMKPREGTTTKRKTREGGRENATVADQTSQTVPG